MIEVVLIGVGVVAAVVAIIQEVVTWRRQSQRRKRLIPLPRVDLIAHGMRRTMNGRH